MSLPKPYQCRCVRCEALEDNPVKEQHKLFNLVLRHLNEQQRRWAVALESKRIGHGGDVEMWRRTGLDVKTIRRGRKELDSGLEGRPVDRVRLPGAGRPPSEKKNKLLPEKLKKLVEDKTAGDPMTSKKWVRTSLRNIGKQLDKVGYRCSPPTVSRLLGIMGYSLKANVKSYEASANHPDRDQQFQYIEEKKKEFAEREAPIISVDTKKKELIGNFKNAGRTWCQEPEQVNIHDFRSDAEGRAVPYGIYDIKKNRGSIVVGTSHDTPRFAVDSIVTWWKNEGNKSYLGAKQLLILTDAGGSDGCSPRMWKKQLQEQLANNLGLEVTVCHYPRGCSKYNPIEHRLFSFISINWAGRVLKTFKDMLSYINHTTTAAGLRVKAYLNKKFYALKEKVSNKEMKELNIKLHSTCPRWNYTIYPQTVA